MSQNALTAGVHHVGLSVPDIRATRAFFIDVLGFEQVGEKPNYPAVFVSDGTVMLTLWQVADPNNAVPFNRKHCIGLHHLALRVASHRVLAMLHDRLLRTDGVAVEFAPEALGTSGMQHMMCAIPGGVRVEFLSTAE